MQSFALKGAPHSEFPFQPLFPVIISCSHPLDEGSLMQLIGLHIPCLNREGSEVSLSKRKQILFSLWAFGIEKAELEPRIHVFFMDKNANLQADNLEFLMFLSFIWDKSLQRDLGTLPCSPRWQCSGLSPPAWQGPLCSTMQNSHLCQYFNQCCKITQNLKKIILWIVHSWSSFQDKCSECPTPRFKDVKLHF